MNYKIVKERKKENSIFTVVFLDILEYNNVLQEHLFHTMGTWLLPPLSTDIILVKATSRSHPVKLRAHF
jgi:hypothetical protein